MVLTVRLGGNNFVSDKTQATFEEALRDGHQVKSVASAPAPAVAASVSPIPSAGPTGAAQTPSIPAPQPATQPPLDYQRLLASLEHGLAQFFDHQSSTLDVHERYLKNQAEYAQIIFQIAHEQFGLSQDGRDTPHQAASTLAVLESLERNMMRFHDHQAETLSVHEQHLKDQAEFSKTFGHLLQQPYAILTSGNFPPHTVELPPVVPAIVKDIPTFPPVASPPATSASTQVAPVAVSASPPASLLGTVPSLDLETLSRTLLEVVSEKTGYPAEMLELDMDMEADLGIDSIKRVEILGAMQSSYPDLPQVNPEELAELRTLGQIVHHMGANLQVGRSGSAPVAPDDGAGSALPLSIQGAQQPGWTDVEALSKMLLEVVSEKTGYPAEMLELDMDMEADLGIDSIKRVEILGAVQSSYPDLPQVTPEELAELRTLGQIIDHMSHHMPTTGKKKRSTEGQEPALNHSIERSLVKLKPLPAPDRLEFTMPENHICLITDDGTSTSIRLAQALSEQGWRVVLLNFPLSVVRASAERQPLANLASSDGISQVLLQDMSEDHLKQQLATISASHGPVGVFIHLNPARMIRTNEGEGLPGPEKAVLKHVFLMAKHLKQSLTEAARLGRSCFLTVARLDGEFGLGGGTDFEAISGGLFGLTKALNLEWAGVFCRAIDLSPDLDPGQSVRHVIAELYDPNLLLVEVGHSKQGRTTLVCESNAAEAEKKTVTARDGPDVSSVFLVSGGAKGITALCTIKLAERYRCRFVLVGRSSIAEPEPAWARGCVDEAELKRRAMEDLISKGERPNPKYVQRMVNPILSRQEIERTLHAIEQAGGQVEYLSVDVTDGPDLQAKLQVASQRLGPITGIIHGAGTLADKLIEKKSEQDFERVYSPKVKGLENLLDCVPASQLDYLILFSSVAAFHGNVGQTDYAIANEILNKAAYLVKRDHPSCHVVSINWGPWDAGMVTPELKKVFSERGVEVIPIEVGTRMLVDELVAADQAPQIVIGSPLVTVARELEPALRTFRIRRRLTLEANPFLQDHVIGGHAVLPIVCALAWFANACEQLYPGYKFFSSEDLKVLTGIVFDETLASEHTLDLKEVAKADAGGIVFEATIWSVTGAGKTRSHYTARVTLLRQIPAAPTFVPFDGSNVAEATDRATSGASLYHDGTLFHGPCFRGVERVLDISPQKLTTRCVSPEVQAREQGQFPVQTFNPFVADGQFQSLVLWGWHFRQAGSLPMCCQKSEQFQEIPCEEASYVSLEVQSSTENSLVADIITHDAQGQVYSRLSGAEVTISERLNSLYRQNRLL